MDLRKKTPYEVYENINFEIPIGKTGDCFDRFLIRVEEMRQSLKIIIFSIQNIPDGLFKIDDFKLNNPTRVLLKKNMENIIQHFKFFSKMYEIKKNENYIAIEAPKGEFGIFLITNNKNKAYRCKIKAPGFLHLQGINFMSQKHLLADIVTIIGTQDIVFGEVDR